MPSPSPTPTATPTPTPTPTPGQSTIVASAPAPTYAQGSGVLDAYNALNDARVRCGFGAIAQSAALDLASLDHATYMTRNYDAGRADAFSHTQNVMYPFFTGADALARAKARGYQGVAAIDEIAPTGSTGDAAMREGVSILLSANYHMAALMDRYTDVGFGVVTSGANGNSFYTSFVSVHLGISNYNTQRLGTTDIAAFPCNGSTVQGGRHISETPNPLPGRDLVNNPAGRPFLIAVRDDQALTVNEWTISTAGSSLIGATIKTQANDTKGLIPKNRAVLIPNEPLSAGTYSLKFVGTADGQARSLTWTVTIQ